MATFAWGREEWSVPQRSTALLLSQGASLTLCSSPPYGAGAFPRACIPALMLQQLTRLWTQGPDHEPHHSHPPRGTLANTISLTRRDCVLVTLAGLIPDVDGVGIVGEVFTRNSAYPLLWWSEYHHVLGH